MAKKQIVLAEYDDETKSISVIINSNHVPTLAFVSAQIQYQITETIAMDRTKQELQSQSKVIVPENNKPHGIIDFIRRKRY